MGATFSRITNWITGQTLTASALNAEFDNILNNLTPGGIDDESSTTTAMRATTDPYPASTESLATSLQGELQRIRYVIAQITGKTYWYQDPDTSLAALVPSGTKMWFYQNTAPTGWTIDATPADAVLAVKGGSNAYNTTGGTQAGSWTHIHAGGSHTHTGPSHTHKVGLGRRSDGAAAMYVDANYFPPSTFSTNVANGSLHLSGSIINSGSYYEQGVTTAAGTGNTGSGGTVDTASAKTSTGDSPGSWRPLAQIGIICTKD